MESYLNRNDAYTKLVFPFFSCALLFFFVEFLYQTIFRRLDNALFCDVTSFCLHKNEWLIIAEEKKREKSWPALVFRSVSLYDAGGVNVKLLVQFFGCSLHCVPRPGLFDVAEVCNVTHSPSPLLFLILAAL